jgi:5-methylthioadenosine/S-adenosylhomocysteine deaminase
LAGGVEVVPHELLLKGGYVVTLDDSVGNLQDADFLTQAEQIISVRRNMATSAKGAQVIDVMSRLIIPGLVNTHGHGAAPTIHHV